MKNRKELMITQGAAVLATAFVAFSALLRLGLWTQSFQRLDRWMQDALYQHESVASGDIVVIGIDEDAIEELGPYNTWGRDVIASALEALASDPENMPAAVAVDVLYTGSTTPEADERLAKAAQSLGCMVTASMVEFGTQTTWENGRAVSMDTSAVTDYLQPYEALKQSATEGHINAMTDSDGILRHALLYVEPEKGQKVYSMACQTARIFLTKHGKELTLPPTNAAGHFYVPFTCKPGNYSDGMSVAWLVNNELPSGYWADKVVLIGPYAAVLQDIHLTSIDRGSPMYGVEFQANVIQSLLDGNFKTEVSDLLQILVLLVICVAASVFFFRLKVLPGLGIWAGLVLLGVGCAFGLYQLGFVIHIIWLPFAATMLYLASLAYHYELAARERQALALENERISTELSVATRIQTSSLPKVFPPFPDRTDFDIYASMTPAKEVGGDLYDFFLMDDDHLCMTIGDVSGKGVPAALFMMQSNTLLHHVSMREKSPAVILKTVNEEVCSRNPEEMFVTVWLGVLELSTGILTAANAGHEYPVIKQPDGHFELLKDRHGFVLGGLSLSRYREYTVQLQPGARVFVYTDGIPEAVNSAEEAYGTDRMLAALQSVENGPPSEIVKTVKNNVAAFVGSAPQFDDLTMICLEYSGKRNEPAEPTFSA